MVVVFTEYGQSTFLKIFSWGSSKSADSKGFGVDHQMVGFDRLSTAERFWLIGKI